MKQEQVVSLQTFRALQAFFKNEQSVINASAMLKEEVAMFNDKLAFLESNLENQTNTDGFTGEERVALKEKIATETVRMLNKLMAHAIKTKNMDLKDACLTKKTTLTNANDLDFVTLAKIELDKMSKYPEVLDAYGLDAAFRKALTDNLTFYETVAPTMRVDRAKSKGKTSSRNAAFDDLMEFTDFVLTQSVDSLPDTHAVFIKAFNDIKTPPQIQQPAKVVIKTIFDGTKLPAPFVKIDALGIGYTGITDEHGKLTIKVGDKKELSFIASKDDHHNESFSLTKIKKGKTTQIVVQMRNSILALAAGN
jgi:hypothetical protein